MAEQPAEDSVTTEVPTEAPKKKSGVCSKIYIDADGGETRSAHAGAVALQFRFNDDAETVRSIALDGFPDNISTALSWFGRSEKFGNFYAGVKGDAGLAVERFDAGLELLMTGEWVEKGEGVGTAPSLVVEAIARALVQAGQEVSEEARAKIAESCKDKATREGAKKDPAINAQIKAITAERAMERAVKAQEAAEGTVINPELFQV